MGRNDYSPGLDLFQFVCEVEAASAKRIENRLIVNQWAEDRGSLVLSLLTCQRDGVADAKTHPEVSSAKNSHKMK